MFFNYLRSLLVLALISAATVSLTACNTTKSGGDDETQQMDKAETEATTTGDSVEN